MRPPRVFLGVGLLTAAYFPCSYWFDRSPERRPLEEPYSFLQTLERDGVLRSDWFGQEIAVRKAKSRSYDFDTAARTASQLHASPGVAHGWTRQDLAETNGAVAFSLTDPQERTTLQCESEFPASPFPALVWSARLKLIGSDKDSGELTIHLAPGTGEPDPRFRVRTSPSTRPKAAAPVVWANPPLGQWLDVQLGIPGAFLRDATTLVATVVTSAQTIVLDQCSIQPGTELDGLLAGGHPRGVNVVETTRELKRMVRRGPDERLCLAMPNASTLTYELQLPPEPGELLLGVSAACHRNQPGRSEFVVGVSREGEFEETVLRSHVRELHRTHFVDHRVDLTRFAGERVRIQFRARSSDEFSGPTLLLANPVFRRRPLSESPRPPTILLLSVSGSPTASEPPSFGRMETDSVRFSEVHVPSRDRNAALLSLMTSCAVPTAGPGPREHTNLSRTRPLLAEALTQRGYHCFAATERSRDGTLLRGFPERWNGNLGDSEDAVVNWLDRYGENPCFVWWQLPEREPGTAISNLLQRLQARGLLEPSLVVLVPEADAAGAEIAFRDSSRLAPDQVRDETVSLWDVAPTILSLAQLAPEPSFGGRDVLATPEPAAWSVPSTSLRYVARTLPRLREAVVPLDSSNPYPAPGDSR